MSKEKKHIKRIGGFLAVVALVGLSTTMIYMKKNNENSLKDKINTEDKVILNDKEEINVEDIEKNEAENEKELQEAARVNEIQEEISKVEAILNDPLFILVNKENSIGADYVPGNLELSNFAFLDYIQTRNLEATTASAAKKMFDDALKDGITLLGASGYRSYEVQASLFNGRAATLGEEQASLYTARPGTSEHQTGLALDILGADYQLLDDGFENSESFNWLINNSHKYGFILRYLKGREDKTGYGYEPWHYRYIGDANIAKEIMERDITFEEYIEELNNRLEELKKMIN